jgi:hypothetical protein
MPRRKVVKRTFYSTGGRYKVISKTRSGAIRTQKKLTHHTPGVFINSATRIKKVTI